MLRNLLIQDTLFNKRILLFYAVLLPVFFILYPLLTEHAGMVVGSCFAYLGILPATILGREHRFRTAVITCSLPVTRTQVVKSKYLAALAFCAGGIAVFLFIVRVNPLIRFPRQEVFNLKTIATGVFVLSACMAFMYPPVMRFGVMGIAVIMIVLQVLGALLLLLTKFLSRGFRSGIDGVFSAVGSAFRFLQANLGHPGYPLALIAAGLILMALSYLACVAIFKRKEL